MDKTVIKVEQLSKQYFIGGQQPPERTLREALADLAPWRLARRWLGAQATTATRQMFWALNNVSFTVQEGEVVGIIGKNGAGKSTLLKVLSRITEPTSGYAEIYGRVGSLLEVGTGFHPELTGRENIYLNGSILGMKKHEIESKFSEIVVFSEIGEFIDTAVKHYSSGMYLRLAFAVAAHLEPEILLVDEVLAVGDASFQKKCLGKMKDVAKAGKTVLFISHNMSAVQHLCQRVIWIDKGTIRAAGEPQAVISSYLHHYSSNANVPITSRSGTLQIVDVLLKTKDAQPASVFYPGDAITIELHYQATEPIPNPYFWLNISNHSGDSLFSADMMLDGCQPEMLTGQGVLRCTFRQLPLLPHQVYFVRFGGYEKDGRSLLFEASEIANFSMLGDARALGFYGEMADKIIKGTASVIVPYRWDLPDSDRGWIHPPAALTMET